MNEKDGLSKSLRMQRKHKWIWDLFLEEPWKTLTQLPNGWLDWLMGETRMVGKEHPSLEMMIEQASSWKDTLLERVHFMVMRCAKSASEPMTKRVVVDALNTSTK